MNFDSMLRSWEPDGDAYRWTAPAGWGQGRALFGGMIVAAGAALSGTLTTRVLRTVQAQFLGPVVAGPVTGHAKILREGRTTTFVEVRLSQDGKERAVLSSIHVNERPEAVRVDGDPPPQWKHTVGDLQPIPFMPGITPEFTQHLDMRFATGAIPFSGSDTAHFGGYARIREDSEETSELHQLALLDAWPVPTLARLSGPAFASTVTWTAHLLGSSAPGFHQFDYRTFSARNGFSTAAGQLWDSSGQLVGYTEQLVAVFD